MTKPTKKQIHAQKVADARAAQRRRGRCRQCERRPGINPFTGKRYRMCKVHRDADCARKKADV